MTRTARRRFAREMESIVDGLAIGAVGPVFLHCYDQPAGGKWVDDVIPGKLVALDRTSGEQLWVSPCEVGYGRGFGAGFGPDQDLVVLGPSAHGHRIVRMRLDSGELLGVHKIDLFDAALVGPDVCITTTPKAVVAIDTSAMEEAWQYRRPGERYHDLARHKDSVYVVYTNANTSRQGVLRLDAKTGKFQEEIVAARLPAIQAIAAWKGGVTLLTRDLGQIMPREAMPRFMTDLALHPDGGNVDSLTLVSFAAEGAATEGPRWWRILSSRRGDAVPDISMKCDDGKLYLVQEALIDVRDALTGRALGEWTVPGLDESVAWEVCQGAALVAEEERASLYELPA
jgi:outer membrane protein assembly factor BamB